MYSTLIRLSLILFLCSSGATSLFGQENPGQDERVKYDVSPPLRDIPRKGPVPGSPRQVLNKTGFKPTGPGGKKGPDPLLQLGPDYETGLTPAPLSSFPGLSDDDNFDVIGNRAVPPDTEGDVGPDHYIQAVNMIFAIYDKDGSICGSPGCIVPGGEPRPINDLWTGFGGVCETNNDGDPVVLYDHLADRWMISQFGIGGFSPIQDEGNGWQCMAVSTSSDPLDTYYRYGFRISDSADNSASISAVNDYPKIGVWPDGYYLSANEFQCPWITLGLFPCTYSGPIAVAFEREKMLQGLPASFQKFGPLSTSFFSMQPSHLEGPAPPAGTPNTYVMAFDDQVFGTGANPDGYKLWEFSVDWNNPGNSSFTPLAQLDTTAFDSNLCFSNDEAYPCIPQPSPGVLLDPLSQFTMFRAQFRDFGTHKSIGINHTVDASGTNHAGIRWAELRNSGNGWTVHQTGTYAPDSDHRWMGSMAMDGSGNIALGYSVSSSTTYPSIRYTSRMGGDTPGTMPGGEVELQVGTGSQINNQNGIGGNRWGDYSTMSVDPTDDCTFWYTQEYYENTASFDFKTLIGSFKFDNCGIPPVCGNGVQEQGEDCDDTDLGGSSCQSLGYAGGTLACDGSCAFDTTGCLESICGNGLVEGTEDCDDSNLNGQTCEGLGYDGGTLGCDGTCNFDASSCTTCGNDIKEAGEACDGTDLDGLGCAECGILTCLPDCSDYDSSDCHTCTGNCDNDGLCEAGEDCTSCAADCPSGSTTGAECGNGICETLDGEDCLTCAADCNGRQTGKPSGRFCCGLDKTCSDSRCTDGFQCTEDPAPSGAFCCGDLTCDTGEDCGNCSLDCTLGAEICDSGIDENCDGNIDCADASCSSDPICQPCVPEPEDCLDGQDNDCDGLVDGDDPDCASACLDSGAACTANTECCSQKCLGKKGSQTCK